MALSAGADDATVAPRVKLATAKTPVAGDDDLKITIDPEYWRLIAYIFFWSMCGFAITLSKVLVSPMLAKGPEIEGDTCGPFNRVRVQHHKSQININHMQLSSFIIERSHSIHSHDFLLIAEII
mmetsp:Transcript_15749/g.24182  ORF Transcript_15749/g.24182 Transcript_15749/m.24182 type:complete len:124 (+) Transcript_15749:63-434(+)